MTSLTWGNMNQQSGTPRRYTGRKLDQNGRNQSSHKQIGSRDIPSGMPELCQMPIPTCYILNAPFHNNLINCVSSEFLQCLCQPLRHTSVFGVILWFLTLLFSLPSMLPLSETTLAIFNLVLKLSMLKGAGYRH